MSPYNVLRAELLAIAREARMHLVESGWQPPTDVERVRLWNHLLELRIDCLHTMLSSLRRRCR